MILILSFQILIVFVLSFRAFRESKKSLINPYSIYLIWDYFLLSLLPVFFLKDLSFESDIIFELLVFNVILGLGFFLGYDAKFLVRPACIFLSKKILQIDAKDSMDLRHKSKAAPIFFFVSVVSYSLLAVIGGGGFLWILDPREAYIANRAGAGIFWMLSQWFLLLAQIVLLPRIKHSNTWCFFVLTFLFCSLSYFTGSKANVLSCMVVSIVFYNFYIKKLTLLTISSYGLTILAIFSILLGYQSTGFVDLGKSVSSYFTEYYNTIALYLNHEFLPLGLGEYYFSSLWGYLPRALFPSKPYEYGVLLVHQVLFPGSAEQGHTPGIHPWFIYYLDFSYVGMFLYALIGGIGRRAVFDLIIEGNANLSLFILFVSFCVFNVFALASPFMIIILAIFVAKTKKIKL